ncbi:hypothetical protein DAPPUDRAFT_244307 [Daphnia pulex]|uniref:Uncharacterized protein n=1 Tax=Daphnia pulex TaxID=6669 RepID=E9GKN2_DAPPU|nr:hypothetical protein DAPPUDRAFT_244307 [Daphnia pulex]|eukprot:EFX80032.1 hypothetical protein DAPPUDRAFT_244307 [Daphnia pulex]
MNEIHALPFAKTQSGLVKLDDVGWKKQLKLKNWNRRSYVKWLWKWRLTEEIPLLVQNVAMSMDEVIEESRAANVTTYEESNVWDDWEPDLESIEFSILEKSGSLEQSTVHNQSSINAVEEPKAIGIELPISIVARHPEHINVSNGVVKLSNKERLGAFIDGREVKWFELDKSGHGRVLIALHQDLKKLLSYINAQSAHQFAESDILLANGIFVGSLEKRHNIINAMQRSSKKCPGKTPTCVLRFYSVSEKVKFVHLADFCSQCGPVNHIQTEVTKEGKKTVFVELAVKRSVAEAFLKIWAKGCQINNTSCVMLMSHFITIHKKTDAAKDLLTQN